MNRPWWMEVNSDHKVITLLVTGAYVLAALVELGITVWIVVWTIGALT